MFCTKVSDSGLNATSFQLSAASFKHVVFKPLEKMSGVPLDVSVRKL